MLNLSMIRHRARSATHTLLRLPDAAAGLGGAAGGAAVATARFRPGAPSGSYLKASGTVALDSLAACWCAVLFCGTTGSCC